MAIYRSGMADALIEQFLHPRADSPPPDVGTCQDCNGSGFYYPQGPGHGVVKCKHERLGTSEPLYKLQVSSHRLTVNEIREQAGIIAELLDSGYTMAQAEEQLATSVHPDDWRQISALLPSSHLSVPSKEATSYFTGTNKL
jgi:hypothetical protein